jgi:hypothetical protein
MSKWQQKWQRRNAAAFISSNGMQSGDTIFLVFCLGIKKPPFLQEGNYTIVQ